jgi:hypothetical protein
MPADLRHSVFGRFHDGGAGDNSGAAVIHFGVGALPNLYTAGGEDGCAKIGKLPADRL